MNPAVSFTFFLTARLSFVEFLVYTLAQLFGAFIASTVVFLVYLDALQAYEPGMFSLETAGNFLTT